MSGSPTGAGAPMTVVERSIYRGPHLFSATPMIRIQLDLGVCEDWPTHRIGGFADRLMAVLPGLERHGCALGRPGGFVARLRDGTWLGHVVEHVALELLWRAGEAVSRGKTRSVRGRPGVYNILYAYRGEAAGLLAGRCALELVDSLLPDGLRGVGGLDRICAPAGGAPDDLDAVDAALAAAAARERFGPSTAALVEAARRRGIPVRRLNDQSLVQFGWGRNLRRVRAAVTDRTSLVAAEAAKDKAETKALLEAVGVPTARGRGLGPQDDPLAAVARLDRPLVCKPLDGNHGRGVVTGLVSDGDVVRGVAEARRHGRRVLVEEQLPGRDYRVLVVGGRVAAVAERVPPRVVGDGRRTVRSLVEAVNADPRRGEGHEAVMTRIRLDAVAEDWLARQGLGPDSVPVRGQVVGLRGSANLSAGGTAIDRTDAIHPSNALIARRAALAVGLDVAGVDIVAPDIALPISQTGGGVVEVNAGPGLRMHLAPSEGEARDVARPILDQLYPRGAPARIPVLAVTGTNGKSTVGRMVERILAADGRCVGLTNTSGVYVGGEQIRAGDASGPRSARMLLGDPTVEAAVLECARGGILREGLAFDRCDVGAVLNVRPDHLGLKGVETLEDLATVKSVVVEAVGRRGLSVLNADDPLTLRMARHAGGRVCWFSMRGGDAAPGFLLSHIGEGGPAVLHDAASDLVTLHDRGEVTTLCRGRDLPAALQGRAPFNIQNALAAAAMAHGVGVEAPVIARALTTFGSTFEENPGRMNLYREHPFEVILDYAHNPDALRALGTLVQTYRGEGRRAIGMVSIPGDRRDEEIRAMGAVAAEVFDILVFRETPDNRGRERGGVMALLRQGARGAGLEAERIHCVHEEDEAALLSLSLAVPGDLVVLTPTRVERVWEQMRAFRPDRSPGAGPVLQESAHG